MGKEKMTSNTTELAWMDHELTTVELCLRNLTEDQIAVCRQQIKGRVLSEVEDKTDSELLVETMVPVLVRRIRELRLEKLVRRDRSRRPRRRESQ